MQTKNWIKLAERNGWRISEVKGASLTLRCAHVGCPSRVKRPQDALGDIPDPCPAAHVGQFGEKVYDEYKGLVAELRTRRRQLGLDQNDVGEAIGLAQGHINKLESFAKTASPPLLLIWCETLGLEVTTRPAPLPAATRAAIEARRAKPYEPAKAHFKHDRNPST